MASNERMPKKTAASEINSGASSSQLLVHDRNLPARPPPAPSAEKKLIRPNFSQTERPLKIKAHTRDRRKPATTGVTQFLRSFQTLSYTSSLDHRFAQGYSVNSGTTIGRAVFLNTEKSRKTSVSHPTIFPAPWPAAAKIAHQRKSACPNLSNTPSSYYPAAGMRARQEEFDQVTCEGRLPTLAAASWKCGSTKSSTDNEARPIVALLFGGRVSRTRLAVITRQTSLSIWMWFPSVAG